MKYIRPRIDLLWFDETEILTASAESAYAPKDLNEYMYGQGVGSAGNTTITIRKALGR